MRPPTVKILALVGLIGLTVANAFAYLQVNQLISAFHEQSVPPHYPILPVFVVDFAKTAIFAVFASLLAATALSPKKRLSWLLVSTTSLMLFSFALASPSLGSVDNSWNVLTARNLVVHETNPYLTRAGTFPEDPAYQRKWGRWYALPMVYGPLWTALSAVPVLVAKDVRWETFGMMLLNVSGYLIAGGMLYRALRRRDAKKAWYVVVFWMLNVAAILEIANSGHNDGAMLPFLALIAIALLDENLTLAAVGVVCAALIKHWPLALAPALLAIPASNRRRLVTIFASVGAIVAAWLPFWRGWQTLSGVLTMAAYGREPFVFSPFRYATWYVLSRIYGYATVIQTRNAALGFSLPIVAAVTYLAYRRKISGVTAALILLGTYNFIWLSWLQPWYLLAFLPFVAVVLEKTEAVLVMGILGLTGILCYQFGSPMVTGIALLFMAWLALVRLYAGKQRKNSTTTAPQTDPSEAA